MLITEKSISFIVYWSGFFWTGTGVCVGRGGVILISLLLTFDETMCLLRKRRENHQSDVKVDSVSCNFSVDIYLQSLISYSLKGWRRRITWSYFSENWINIATEHVCIKPMATDVDLHCRAWDVRVLQKLTAMEYLSNIIV